MEQVNPTLFQIGVFVVIAVFLIGGINQILKIVDHFKMTPPAGDQFVKIPQCQEFRQLGKAGIDKQLDDVSAKLSDIDKDDRKGRSAIHRDVRNLEDRISKTEGYVETMNQRQIAQGGVLDKILSELGEVKGRLN